MVSTGVCPWETKTSLVERRQEVSTIIRTSTSFGRSLEAVSREKTRAILKEHVPQPIDKGVAEDVEEFTKKITKDHAK